MTAMLGRRLACWRKNVALVAFESTGSDSTTPSWCFLRRSQKSDKRRAGTPHRACSRIDVIADCRGHMAPAAPDGLGPLVRWFRHTINEIQQRETMIIRRRNFAKRLHSTLSNHVHAGRYNGVERWRYDKKLCLRILRRRLLGI